MHFKSMTAEMAAEENTNGSLRFGIMCNGWALQVWQVKAIQILTEKGSEPVLLIFNDVPQEPVKVWNQLVHYPYKNLLYRLFLRFCHHPASKKTVDMQDAFHHIPLIKCCPAKIKHSEYFSESDVAFIKDQHLDFILRFGFNIIRGKILNAARYGVWSFHHGDEQQFRGGPPGFWEIYRERPVTGAILQRLTDRLDAGIVLRKGYFKTIRHSWSGSVDELFMETARWPAQVATDLKNNVNLSWEDDPSTTTAPIYKNPGNLQMIGFVLRLTASRLRFHWNSMTKAEKWNIGLIKTPLQNFLEYPSKETPTWLLSPRSHQYAADPFVMPDQNCLRIFYESYDYRTGKGNISTIKFDPVNGRVAPPTIALEREYHMAYPFLFESDGKWYCVPESAQNHTIDLYLWDVATEKIVFIKTLIHDIDAVDSTVFKHDAYWWLFCTYKSLSDTHLFVWYSDELSGPYTPHHNNPVKTDVRSARPAGPPFTVNGSLMRPAQDCSHVYGGRINIQKIVRLTPSEFEETQLQTIEPFYGTAFPKGIHTMLGAGKYTVIDAKKYVFDRWNFIRQLKMKINRRILQKPDPI